MSKTVPTSVKDAIKQFETAKGVVAAEAEKVELWGRVPPIEKMDATLGTLKKCKHLALSTNLISKISNLAGMDSLEILSLARNNLSRVEGLEPVAGTLQQLWLSYNNISKLDGLPPLPQLRVLYLANNLVRDLKDLEGLPPSLEELSLIGCPVHEAARGDKQEIDVRAPGAAYRLDVLAKLPGLKKLDGVPVTPEEAEAARARTGSAMPGTAKGNTAGGVGTGGLGETMKPKTPAGDAA